jgi:putative phosphoesterase
MRILIISDTHSNIQALSAVIKEKADLVFCLGDIVNYGPNPRECLERVRSLCNKIVRGNHDNQSQGAPWTYDFPWEYKFVAMGAMEFTVPLLQEEDKKYLISLPTVERVEVDGYRLLLSHGSPKGDFWKFIPPQITEEVMVKELEGLEADFIFLGHTHLPLVRKINKTVIVNPGSVGFPSGGDNRASYAVWEDGRVELKRVEYDVEGTIKALRKIDMPREVLESLIKKLTSGWF